MRNPWIKKNPFLSMWLSGANAVVSSMRARATAESKRQAQAIVRESAKQVVNFWSGFLTPSSRKTKKRR
jgi:hypothetical protein